MKKLLIFLGIAPILAFAHNVPSNIEIIPLSSMDLPLKLQEEMQKNNLEQQKNGYILKQSEHPKKLMNMRHKKSFANVTTQNPGDAELKKDRSELSLNFEYRTVLPNTIAYVGLGSETDVGWSGIKTFFDGKEMGACSLSVFNIQGSSENIKLNQEGLTYDVNDKPSRLSVEGSVNSGFIYSVRWYDEKFVRDLECAKSDLKENLIFQMVNFSKKIDSGEFNK
jgi:hypothetical protein